MGPHWDIYCFCLQETQAASANARPNLHSKESKLCASQSFPRKRTTRYLLKPIIQIITYYHSTLWMTDSISQAGCPPITTQLILHFFIDIWQNLSFLVDVLHCFGPGSFRRCASKSSFQTWRQSILVSKNHTLLCSVDGCAYRAL